MSTIIEETVEVPTEETVELPAELEQAEDEIMILRKAHDLLLDQDNWCRGRGAIRRDGAAINVRPWDEGVVQRCVLGAIAWASGESWEWFGDPSPRYVAARERLSREIDIPTTLRDDSTSKIVKVNDGVDGYQRIMAALKRAIS